MNIVIDPETGQPRVGRFGWKASKASLRHQIAGALVNDMSVTSPVFPSLACQSGVGTCRTETSTTDVSEQELVRITDYLSLVGVPAQRSLRSGYPAGVRVSPEHDVDPQKIDRGDAVFATSKCTACHVAQLQTGNSHPFAELRGQTIKPYTDLLLHDMGPGLADTVADRQATAGMWRTAPLWGTGSLPAVQEGAQNARYLHDGRARNLVEAIMWHGGEATTSRRNFEQLPRSDRDALLAFLGSI
jgi:CxxC motif-containing protein (DUF1111 family)